MSSENALKEYSIKLGKTLPMDDPNFLQMLEYYDILPGDSRDKIQAHKTKAEKADYYIQQIVKTSTDLYLPKLIQAMERYCNEYTDIALQELLKQIKAKMNGKFCNTLLCRMCSYMHSCRYTCSYMCM